MESKTTRKTPRAVTLSVGKGFEEEVAYFNEQPNKSHYIWNLVRQDMLKLREDNQKIELFNQMLEHYAKSSKTVDNSFQIKQTVDNSIESKLKKSAMTLIQE